jgi:hypothetical protein
MLDMGDVCCIELFSIYLQSVTRDFHQFTKKFEDLKEEMVETKQQYQDWMFSLMKEIKVRV